MLHLGIYYFTSGDYAKHVEYHQEVRRQLTGTAAYLQHGLSTFPGAWARGHIALGMAELGDFGKIEELGREALEIAEKVENAYTLAISHAFIGMAYLRLGKVKTALEHLEAGYNKCLISTVSFVHSYTAGALGLAYLLKNERAQALSVLLEGTKPEYLERGIFAVHPLTVLADAYRVTGEINLAMETISRALKLASESEERGFESWAMLGMSRINADADRIEDARQWYQRALKQASDLSMRPLIAHCHQGLGDLHQRLGEKKGAQTEIKKACDMYRSLGMTYFMNSKKLI